MREPISEAAYQEWRDIVFQLYFKLGYTRKKILDLFVGALSEWVLKGVIQRYRKENPECPYVLRRYPPVSDIQNG